MTLTVEQAAKKLRISENTLRKYIREGKIDTITEVSGKKEYIVIEDKELQRYAEANGILLEVNEERHAGNSEVNPRSELPALALLQQYTLMEKDYQGQLRRAYDEKEQIAVRKAQAEALAEQFEVRLTEVKQEVDRLRAIETGLRDQVSCRDECIDSLKEEKATLEKELAVVKEQLEAARGELSKSVRLPWKK